MGPREGIGASVGAREGAIESERERAERSPVRLDLLAIVGSLLEEQKLLLSDHPGVALRADVDLAEPVACWIAEAKLARSLSNLINNAREAVAERGKITVGVRRYAREIMIAVADDGCGMPPDVVKRFGERDFTFGKENRADCGSGLGANYAKDAAEAAGGRIQVASRLGEGSIVSLFIPIAADISGTATIAAPGGAAT
jgi:signal transduction histidine kinase